MLVCHGRVGLVRATVSVGRKFRHGTGRIRRFTRFLSVRDQSVATDSQDQQNYTQDPCSRAQEITPITPSLAEIPATRPGIPNVLSTRPPAAPAKLLQNTLNTLLSSPSSLRSLSTPLPLPLFRSWPQQQHVTSEPTRPAAADRTGDLISNATTSSVFELGIWRVVNMARFNACFAKTRMATRPSRRT